MKTNKQKKRMRDYMARRKVNRLKSGLCIVCPEKGPPQPVVKGVTMCLSCLKKRRKTGKANNCAEVRLKNATELEALAGSLTQETALDLSKRLGLSRSTVYRLLLKRGIRLKRGKWAAVVVGVHTGTRLSDDRNYNTKARMWRMALEYLKRGGCSAPVDAEFKSQLSSVKYLYKDGLLLMESKKDYKKRMGKSPDRADSWVLTFAERTKPARKKPPQDFSGSWMAA